MHGSLALTKGLLFVGTQAKTARVALFDLDGRALGGGFSFRDAERGRSVIAGMAVDEDRHVWIADTPAGRVRRFSVFGREIGGLGGERTSSATGTAPAPVLPGLVHAPVDVEALGDSAPGWIAVACGGECRHAVQLFDAELAWRSSLSSLGDPWRPFLDVRRIAAAGRYLYAAEAQARRIQVFREGQFHFAFRLPDRRGQDGEPSALAALPDGRLVVGVRSPESALFLVDGAGQVLRTLARGGEEAGEVMDPCDVAVELGVEDRLARVFAFDLDGLRLQAFTLDGRCLGAIALAAPRTVRRARDEKSHEKSGP